MQNKGNWIEKEGRAMVYGGEWNLSKGRLGRYCEFSLYALVDFSCKRFSVEFPEGFFVFPFWSLAPQTRSIYMFWKCIRVGTVKGPKSWHSRHLPIVMHVPIGKTK